MTLSRSSATAALETLLEKQQPEPLLPSEEMADPRASAEAAGLHYVSDADPGIRRRKAGKGFRYSWPDGTPVKDPATIKRIQVLAIPPAYTDVWICRDPDGHLQAVGRDDRDRKQYRYHEEWRTVRDAVKFHRMLAFGEALPRIREQVSADLRKRGLPREKVVATVVAMLEQTLIRVGNEQYRQQNQSYGVTTLRNRHVSIRGGTARLRFKGKSGKQHDVQVDDPRLVKVVRQCLDIPGQELFQWMDDDGQSHPVGSDDVNAYVKEVTGDEFTAKDFRTWAGTVLAGRLLRATGPVASERAAQTEISRVIKQVAEQLRNTPAVCRKSYVHPAVIDAYVGGFIKPLVHVTGPRDEPERSVEEDALLELLREGAATVKGAARATAAGRA
ncbi:MAG TPA: DNA topoisomerase IB, partial [Candidatus Dormibacteraeota bacterium]|nr:DNA topoisomerase IB [Candidatus Dormibacteraeota bacterium]